MDLMHHLAVAFVATPAPTPKPPESNNSTAASVASSIGPTGLLLLLLMAIVALYVVSLTLHPNAKCNRCKGAGRHHGSLFSYAQRPCNSCKGRGVHPRLGRRVLFKEP
ncbi:hypothetical protein [Kribbella sp. NPDC004536]|uniref:hypothetical protein n=1 Tax=Kribbella sp. NPDC004536 TaxID=3364106 RepID=UPI0036BC4C17